MYGQNVPKKAAFGKGQDSNDREKASGGGSGYFGGGGGASNHHIVTSGAGGSSFVSGYKDCIAVSQNSTSDNLIFLNGSIHYSGLVFKSITMKSGYDIIIDPTGSEYANGHIGPGAAKITFIGELQLCKSCSPITFSYSFLSIFVLFHPTNK